MDETDHGTCRILATSIHHDGPRCGRMSQDLLTGSPADFDTKPVAGGEIERLPEIAPVVDNSAQGAPSGRTTRPDSSPAGMLFPDIIAAGTYVNPVGIADSAPRA